MPTLRLEVREGEHFWEHEVEITKVDKDSLAEAVIEAINAIGDAAMTSLGIPLWQDYDVITLFMGKDRRPYTYMRRDGVWPGEHHWTTYDDERICRMWMAGRVVHVIRDGVPLDPPLTYQATS